MLPKLNKKRALFVLSKIDEILAWEQQKEAERDTRFVELGKYLCEVRAGQYWRMENLKSFDEFLERRFPESRRKAYYLMSIHEHLAATGEEGPQGSRLDERDWNWRRWLVRRVSTSIVQPGCTKRERCRRKSSSGRSRRN